MIIQTNIVHFIIFFSQKSTVISRFLQVFSFWLLGRFLTAYVCLFRNTSHVEILNTMCGGRSGHIHPNAVMFFKQKKKKKSPNPKFCPNKSIYGINNFSSLRLHSWKMKNKLRYWFKYQIWKNIIDLWWVYTSEILMTCHRGRNPSVLNVGKVRENYTTGWPKYREWSWVDEVFSFIDVVARRYKSSCPRFWA